MSWEKWWAKECDLFNIENQQAANDNEVKVGLTNNHQPEQQPTKQQKLMKNDFNSPLKRKSNWMD